MQKMPSITFVTSNITSQKLQELASTGIQLCVYNKEQGHEEWDDSTVKMMKLSTHFIKTICDRIKYTLPQHRNLEKDTESHLLQINSNYEYMKDAIEKNVWNSTHFAWIDPNIFDVFKDKVASKEYLRILSQRTLNPHFFAIPGCWNKTEITEASVDSVNWRFCGGFYIGDKSSVMDFCLLCERHFPQYILASKCLTWDINFWAWLELTTKWLPTWYSADHNDSIIRIPAAFYAIPLYQTPSFTKTVYSYPKIDSIYDSYAPSSASYVRFNGQHILNTRFINYVLTDTGYYLFNHPENIIITKNMASVLDEKTFIPKNYHVMNDDTVNLPKTVYPDNNPCKIYGLEDVRLYESNGKIRFIATNRNYAPQMDTNRMIIGDYDIDTHSYINCQIVEPPQNTWCEKNWTPIIGDDCSQNIQFIYKWSPMEIGAIRSLSVGERPTSGTSAEEVGEIRGPQVGLNIIQTYQNTIYAPDFYRVRGSSVFTVYNGADYLLGVVHFSEEKTPREYFHILVALDKNTFKPVRYSQTFCFQGIGIEFCTGFCVESYATATEHDKYIFYLLY